MKRTLQFTNYEIVKSIFSSGRVCSLLTRLVDYAITRVTKNAKTYQTCSANLSVGLVLEKKERKKIRRLRNEGKNMAHDDHEGHFHDKDVSKSMPARLTGIQTTGSNNRQ